MTYRKISVLATLAVFELVLLYVFAVYWQTGWIIKGCAWALSVVAAFYYWRFYLKKKREQINTDFWKKISEELDSNGDLGCYTIRLHDSSVPRKLVERVNETVYINMSGSENLHPVVSNLLENTAHKYVSVSLELWLSPAENTDIATTLRTWLRNILFLQKSTGLTIPVHWLIQTPVSFLFDRKNSHSVFSIINKKEHNRLQINEFLKNLKTALSLKFLHDSNAQYSHQYIYLMEALNFLEEKFLKNTDSGWEYVDICSLSLADCGNFQNTSEWAAYLIKNTDGLIPSAKSVQHDSVRYILSEYLDKYAVYHRNHISDMIFKVLFIGVAGFFLAASFSTVNNSRLLEQIGTHIADFRMETDKAEQDKKIGLLKQDLKLLEGYRDHGVPAYLGLGLYRAQAYIPKLKALIPAEVPKAPEPVKKPEPVVLTLDSLALFETGQFELKNNANKALIGVLKAIESHPDTQILVEGHTDNVGNPVSNQQLSEKRAQSVKDWLVISSNVPEGRFEVKGFGDTKPIADNQTEDGKAKNRRVEIILIPSATQ
nr:OmpA family protein [uncultured Neisseria sp.]